MIAKVLCVDDEENILRAFERSLRGQYQLETAVGPERGLEAISSKGPFAVVVSDLRMPGMDGISFLAEVRQRSPETVRLILSGNADLDAAIASVNQGSIFQFLTKPCPPERLRMALDAALKQYELISSERVLLEGTLQGSISMLTEVLGVVNPLAFSKCQRIRQYVRHIATTQGLSNTWEFDLAAMLSQIGCITIPHGVLEKIDARLPLSKEEQDTFESHPSVGHDLLERIPRLEMVADMILHQATPLRELRDSHLCEVVTIGAQMLKISLLFDDVVTRGEIPQKALEFMNQRPEIYQPSLVSTLMKACPASEQTQLRSLPLSALRPRMIAQEPIKTKTGFVLVTKGEMITEPLLVRIKNFDQTVGIVQPLIMLTAVRSFTSPPALRHEEPLATRT